jgi:hypothetical protein
MILSPLPVQKFFDNNGNPLVGGKLFTYEAGTTNKIATYTDESGTSQNMNPVELDFRGECNVWLDPEVTYKFVLSSRSDTDPPTAPIWTVDNAAGGLTSYVLTQQFIGKRLWPRTQSEIDNGVTPANYGYPPYDARRYGAVGDGIHDDGPALQDWLDAIPNEGAGYLPAAQVYYLCTIELALGGKFISISGDGLRSRIHYTGTGVALSLTDPRFSLLHNWYLTGTSSATGGVWIKGANEGFTGLQFCADSFTGDGAFAMRLSDSWDVTLVGGALRQSYYGLQCDTTNFGDGGLVNVVNIISVDMSACAINVDFQSGQVLNAIGVDCSEGPAVIEPICAFEIARGVSGMEAMSCVNIIGCWGEGAGSFLRVGRDNTSSITPKFVKIEGCHVDVTGEMVRLYKADQCTIGENEWGLGTVTIDPGVTRTLVETVTSVTDNSTPGQTTYVRQSSVEAPIIQTYMSRVRAQKNGVDQPIPTGVVTQVTWPVVDLDTLGTFNTGNSRLTPLKQGWYRIHAQVTLAALDDGNLVQLSIFKNGSRHRYTNFYAAAAGNPTIGVDALVFANGSTDYFEIFVEHNNGVARSVAGDSDASWFECHPAV